MADTVWKIAPDKAGKYTLATADKYVDRDIEFDLAQASLAAEGSASATIDSVSVGTKSSNKYPVTGSKALSGSASASVATAGFAKDETASAAITGEANLNAQLNAGTLKTTGGSASASLTSVTVGTKSGTNYPITGSGTISGSFGAAVASEGYVRDETASGSISGTASLNATLPAVVLQTSGGTGSASLTSVTVGTKSGSNYPITGSGSITGSFGASVKTAGYGKNESVSGSVSGTASLNAELPAAAATVTLSGTASAPTIAASTSDDNISVGSITTSKPSSGYYAAVKATAPATTLSATKTVNTAGYLGSNTEITASGSTTAKTGSVYYLPVTSGSLSPSESGTDYTGWTEAEVTVPSKGGLKIAEGYYPNTYILLDTMLDGKSDTAGTAAKDIRTGYIAYNVDGEKLTGTMGPATFGINTTTLPAGSATITAPAYNSSTGKFDISSSGTASGTITVTATSDPTGFIDKDTVAKSETVSGSVSGSTALNKIAGSVAISGTKTVTPTIAKQSISISGVTDAANGDATTTAPTSGVYVQVKSSAKTTNVTAAATISTEGYGTNANHGIAGSGNVAVGANASANTYIPIKTGSISSSGNGSASITSITPSYNSTSGKFDVTGSASITGTSTTTVDTAGWISSGTSHSIGGTASVNATLNKVSLTATKSSGNLTVAPFIVRTAKPSGDTWTDAASGAVVSTKPTSGVYVQVDAAAATNTVKIKPQVGTAGYGDTTNYGFTEWSGTVGAAAAGTRYIPITTTAGSAVKGSVSAAKTGDIAITLSSSQPSSGNYIAVSGTEAKYNVTTAGWITSGNKSAGTPSTVYYTLPATYAGEYTVV